MLRLVQRIAAREEGGGGEGGGGAMTQQSSDDWDELTAYVSLDTTACTCTLYSSHVKCEGVGLSLCICTCTCT